MSIVKLPSGYRQLEYIQSSGTQYIDTGFKPKYDTRLVIDISGVGTERGMLFGARDANSATAANQFNMYRFSETTMRSDYFGTNATITITDTTPRTVIDKNANVVLLYDTTITNTAVSSGECTNTLYLFCLNNAGTATSFNSYKLYSCQIYDNGSLVRDFIPCINDSGVVGLYDLIGGAFYGNAGTGAFTAGRYVYSEDEIKKLEYIESSGTQYVDSGFAPNQDTRVVMDVQAVDSAQAFVFGGRNGSGESTYCLLVSSATGLRSDYNTTPHKSISVASTITRLTIDKNKNVTRIVDGETEYIASHTYSSFSSDYNLWLFAVNTAGALTLPISAKLYSCQIYDDGTIVRDYYPASVDGEVGLWDALSGVFYENDGTGDFLAGPLLAVDTPTDFEQIMAVYLKWAAVDCEGYKIYRNGVFLGSTTNTFYADLSAEENENYVYTLLAYRGSTESEPVDLEVYTRSGYFTIKPLIQSAFFQ